jgi:hypothetical protein
MGCNLNACALKGGETYSAVSIMRANPNVNSIVAVVSHGTAHCPATGLVISAGNRTPNQKYSQEWTRRPFFIASKILLTYNAGQYSFGDNGESGYVLVRSIETSSITVNCDRLSMAPMTLTEQLACLTALVKNHPFVWDTRATE